MHWACATAACSLAASLDAARVKPVGRLDRSARSARSNHTWPPPPLLGCTPPLFGDFVRRSIGPWAVARLLHLLSGAGCAGVSL